MDSSVNIAIAAEFELCEKLVEAIEGLSENNPHFVVERLAIVEVTHFNEEQSVRFNNKTVAQISSEEVQWDAFNYVLFAGDIQHAAHIAKAAESGCIVLDLKGTCAMLQDVPVVVPNVNEQEIEAVRQRNIICLPDPQVSQLALSLAPFISEISLNSLFVTSLLPTSYTNGEKVSQLAGQTAKLLNGIPLDEEEQRLAFDVFPTNEKGLTAQLQRIFPQLNNVIFHQIQVPVFYGLAQQVSLNVDYNDEINPDLLISAWQTQADIDYSVDKLITPVINGEQENGESQTQLHISSLSAVENGLQFWTVADEQRFNIAQLGCKLLLNLYNQGY